MRIVSALGAVAALAIGLSGCAVVSAGTSVLGAGASVGASVVGTAADVAGDVISLPFSDDAADDHKK